MAQESASRGRTPFFKTPMDFTTAEAAGSPWTENAHLFLCKIVLLGVICA